MNKQKIKNLLVLILPTPIFDVLIKYIQMLDWRKRNYLAQAPQFVKQEVFLKYGIANAQWVETGTYKGITTTFLANHFSQVHSIEPAQDLYEKAVKLFKGKNVSLYNDVSESVLPYLLPKLNGEINFWLDGHSSDGITFKGKKDCPVEDELSAIKRNLSNFTRMTILIDDVRIFASDSHNYSGYPSIDYLVDWARENRFSWQIEHDIFIMVNY